MENVLNKSKEEKQNKKLSRDGKVFFLVEIFGTKPLESLQEFSHSDLLLLVHAALHTFALKETVNK